MSEHLASGAQLAPTKGPLVFVTQLTRMVTVPLCISGARLVPTRHLDIHFVTQPLWSLCPYVRCTCDIATAGTSTKPGCHQPPATGNTPGHTQQQLPADLRPEDITDELLQVLTVYSSHVPQSSCLVQACTCACTCVHSSAHFIFYHTSSHPHCSRQFYASPSPRSPFPGASSPSRVITALPPSGALNVHTLSFHVRMILCTLSRTTSCALFLSHRHAPPPCTQVFVALHTSSTNASCAPHST